MGFVERIARQGVCLSLDATTAFGPGLVGRQMARRAIAWPSCAVRRLVAVLTGGPFHFVESHLHVVTIRNHGLGPTVRGRHKVTIRACGIGMSALQHVIIIVLELDGRSKCILAVAELAGTGQSPGMDIFVTIDAILRQSQIGGATRL